jgi:hypothetical protein
MDFASDTKQVNPFFLAKKAAPMPLSPAPKTNMFTAELIVVLA